MNNAADSYGDLSLRLQIQHDWKEYGTDAFEMWSRHGIDNADIEQAVGPAVAQEYSSWIYYNLK